MVSKVPSRANIGVQAILKPCVLTRLGPGPTTPDHTKGFCFQGIRGWGGPPISVDVYPKRNDGVCVEGG